MVRCDPTLFKWSTTELSALWPMFQDFLGVSNLHSNHTIKLGKNATPTNGPFSETRKRGFLEGEFLQTCTLILAVALWVPNALRVQYPWEFFLFLDVTLGCAETPFAKTPPCLVPDIFARIQRGVAGGGGGLVRLGWLKAQIAVRFFSQVGTAALRLRNPGFRNRKPRVFIGRHPPSRPPKTPFKIPKSPPLLVSECRGVHSNQPGAGFGGGGMGGFRGGSLWQFMKTRGFLTRGFAISELLLGASFSGKEKDDDHDQNFLPKDVLHIWSWSSKTATELLQQ